MATDSATSPKLEGYTLEQSGDRSVYVRDGFRDAVIALGFLEGQASNLPVAKRGGRVLHEVFELGDGTRVLWKRCRRGGLIEPFLGYRHFDVRRFFVELRVTALAETRGLNVAPVLALAIEPYDASPIGAKRVELLTPLIEDAIDIGETLKAIELERQERRQLIRGVACALRRFHGEGFSHGDLNLKNILWRERPDGEIEVTLIDLDPGMRPAPTATHRHRNLLRLWRSYLKGASVWRWRLSATDRYRFVHEYFRADRVAIASFWRRAARVRTASRIRYGLRPRTRSQIGGSVGS